MDLQTESLLPSRNSADETTEPIQILRTTEGHELELDHDALNDVLCHRSVGNKPISLISIVGTFRKGKSFLLNFILRYLQSDGYKNPSWIGGDNDELCGFEWRGGIDPQTEGVWMWSKPFIVKKDGEEVAVFLIDCQGHFAMKTGKGKSVLSVIVSMLCSSVTIFNISGQIGSPDLEFTENCIEYSERTNQGDLAYPLQAMMFLIRDWADSKYPYGEEGGKEYLKKELGETKADGFLERMRAKLLHTFEPVECFLMPHPGFEVQESDFKGQLSALKAGFVGQLSQFCDKIANPNNLVLKKDIKFSDRVANPKRLVFRNMNGHKLVDLLIRNFDKMKANSWELLDSRSYEEIKQDNEASEAFYQVAGDIGKKVDKILENGHLPPKEFDKKYQQILNGVMVEFRKNIKFLGEKGVKRQEKRLKTYLDLRHFKRGASCK